MKTAKAHALEGCNGEYLYANIICDPMVVGILSLIHSRQKANLMKMWEPVPASMGSYICLWNSVTLANYIVMPTTPPLNHIVYIDAWQEWNLQYCGHGWNYIRNGSLINNFLSITIVYTSCMCVKSIGGAYRFL